jgi:TetR/AcrR family transcriptional regulator, cholesterol catabolism regulator
MGGPETDGGRASDDRILGIVVEILEAEGYEAVQLREVARRARMSLSTIYKHYANRDDMILAALRKWMAENRYSGVSRIAHRPDDSMYDALMRLLRTIFEPWEQHPAMLAAFYRARSSPGGDSLLHQGLDVVVPAAMEIFADVDDGFVADFEAAISSLVYGLLGRFAAGEIEITDIMPSIDRTVYWITSGYEAVTRPAAVRQRRE